ncbi:MAG TPA: phage tail sheath subtilisin-like domain-containing protein, partial [Blastocatellia bacterium]|nr:phage tail sheath subtilisin-like domain-containing protein [Blastocatellia bacterium]
MPATLTYPGVYIEEIPSGVRTITGVATSITAFIGRALRGPVNEPVTVTSFGDFERAFGGLGEKYPMSYAVKDFYLNGGSTGIIVRLYHSAFTDDAERQKVQAAAQSVADAAVGGDADTAAKAARAKAETIKGDAGKSKAEKDAAEAVAKAAEAAAKVKDASADTVKAAATKAVSAATPRNKAGLKIGDINLDASSEGSWGNKLRARVEGAVPQDVADRYGLAAADMFNLLIRDGKTGNIEKFLNVSVKPSVRQLDKVLLNESNLVRVAGSLPGNTPKPSDDGLSADDLKVPPFSGGDTDKRSTGVAQSDQAANGSPLGDADYEGSEANKTGLFALNKADLFNLLCIPPDTRDGDTSEAVYEAAMKYCLDRRAVLIVDSSEQWSANKDTAAAAAVKGLSDWSPASKPGARNAAIFFPRVLASDSEREGQVDTFVPCGIVAGVMARTDAQRGVWKAPAGLDAGLSGIQGLEVNLNDPENGLLNPLGINCLRRFPVYGSVVWGARTLRGADQLGDEYKYIPVRR